ncbi:hypothetical protein P3T36_007279 [Kitasatospora sp. MAP12-15]|nr:hypothetical protein [Kitasatospora sp. MAP12-44]
MTRWVRCFWDEDAVCFCIPGPIPPNTTRFTTTL